MPPLSRAKKKVLIDVINTKQSLVCAIHPVLLLGHSNPPILNVEQCLQIEEAATTLQNALRIAERYISDPQVLQCFHSSENAVNTIRQKLVKWRGGDEFPCQLDVLLSAILPPSIMQTDDFIAISEDALTNIDSSDTVRNQVELNYRQYRRCYHFNFTISFSFNFFYFITGHPD